MKQMYLTRSYIVILKDNSFNDTQSKITQTHVVFKKNEERIVRYFKYILYCRTKQDKWIRHKL
jgi:hypothetical protein